MPTENRSSNTEQMVSFPRELSDEMAERIARAAHVCGGGAYEIWEAICEGFDKPADQHQGEPVLIQAVAVTRADDEDGLRLEWLLEGGIAEMEFPGQVLFAMAEANDLCAEDGSAYVYLQPPADPEGVERLHKGHVKALEVLNQQTEKQRDHWMAECEELRTQLRLITGDYRTAIVNGHERITFLGGDCDSVEKMLADNPNYAKARALLEHKP